MTPDEILDQAAQVIEQRGWTQGDFLDHLTGGVCAIGAINVVTWGEALASAIGPQVREAVAEPRIRVIHALAREIDPDFDAKGYGAPGVITWFNDEDDTRPGDVIDKMRWAAKRLRDDS